jgi:hypothetical protein
LTPYTTAKNQGVIKILSSDAKGHKILIEEAE